MRNQLIQIVVLTICGYGAPASASIVLTAPNLTVSPGGTGAFDVLLTNTGPSSVSIGGFSFDISTANAAIQFTDATIATLTDPYIFAGNSTFGPSIATMTGQELIASDLPANFTAAVLPASTTVSLGRAFFSISPSATPGMFTILFSQTGSSLADANGNNVPINTFSNGQFTIRPSSGVPEPATLALTAIALVISGCYRKRRR